MLNKGYPVDWLETLKAKNDIVSVISKYITLEKKGRNFWGRCPFHHERTPSFSVNEIEQYYHCFGCSESGDVIKFIEKYESVDFVEAVKILANNVNMEVPSFTGDADIAKKKKIKERIIELLNIANEHYQENLLKPDAKKAQEYIKNRGLTGKELKNFQIGFCQDWNEMIKFLFIKGFSVEEMQNAGIAETKNGRAYDVFGGRLMFPIINLFGDCIGFSGRVLEKTDFAKYKNTAQTLVFDKSRTVYAIDLIKKAKQEGKLDGIIIVEGQMDVIAMHRAGFENTVACMGTALTPLHAKEIKRFTDKVFVCFDGDSAGQKATLRSLDILSDAGLDVKVVALPDGKDPDEMLKIFGADKLKEYINFALPIVDYRLSVAQNKYDLSKASEKSLFLKEAIEIVKQIDSPSQQDTYLEIIKQKTSVPIDILRRDLIANGPTGQVSKNDEEVEDVLISRENGNIKAVKFILASLVHKKEYADFKHDLQKYFCDGDVKKLYEYLKLKFNTGESFSISNIFDAFDVEKSKTLSDIINYPFNGNESKKYFDECVWTIIEDNLKEKQKTLAENFKNETDISTRREIAEKLNKITKMLKTKNVEEVDG